VIVGPLPLTSDLPSSLRQDFEQLANLPLLDEGMPQGKLRLDLVAVFQAFELQILYDKAERRIEISATVSEAISNAFENKKALPKEGSLVVMRDIAGARFVSRYHRLRIRESTRHPH
jgi:hypothetical protein